MALTVHDVEPGVKRILMSSAAGRAVGYDASAYLLDGVLVDTGFKHAASEFREAVNTWNVRAAVVTHWHEDHAANVPLLASQGIPICLHPQTEAILRERPPVPLYRRIVWGTPRRLISELDAANVTPVQIIHAPGHTPDHQVAWHAERRIVATGDLFLGVKVRLAHHTERPRELVQSLRMVAALEPRLLLDAHRGVIENPDPLIRAKIDWLEETIGQIETLARQGLGERQIRQQVLGPEELSGWVSAGEYSRRALVHAVLNEDVSSSYRQP